MRFIIALLVALVCWGLAIWSLVSGISDCYTYFFTDFEPTGGQVAWAILRIVPLAEILGGLGWILGAGTFFVGGGGNSRF